MAIRRAAPKDAQSIAEIHRTSWAETYAGLLPDEVISRANESDRDNSWARLLDDFSKTNRGFVLLAELAENPCGFICCVSQRDDALRAKGFSAEVGAIYILQHAQGLGIGRALMQRAASDLSAAGHESVSLWVLDSNKVARRFYEALGGSTIGTREEERPGATLTETAYGWLQLTLLAGEGI